MSLAPRQSSLSTSGTLLQLLISAFCRCPLSFGYGSNGPYSADLQIELLEDRFTKIDRVAIFTLTELFFYMTHTVHTKRRISEQKVSLE